MRFSKHYGETELGISVKATWRPASMRTQRLRQISERGACVRAIKWGLPLPSFVMRMSVTFLWLVALSERIFRPA
eukprot:1433362-Pleurochrysis_carterae.AAC.3